MSFRTLLDSAQSRNNSTLAIGLAPVVDELPLSIQRYDDPFLPFGKAVIDVTSELVCAYVFHVANYLALGAAGAVALERTIAYVPTHIVKILHGSFASPDYAAAVYEGAFGADAVTLALNSQAEIILPYLRHEHHGVFVEAKTGSDVQPYLKLNEDYPGQIGIFRQVEPAHNVIGVFYPPYPQIDWRWDSAIYASRNDDFRDALHDAVLKLKQTPNE